MQVSRASSKTGWYTAFVLASHKASMPQNHNANQNFPRIPKMKLRPGALTPEENGR